MEYKLVSIIVPVYNVENYINRCVDSLIKQTYKNIEIILVNDGSSDNSGIICDKYSEDNLNIRTYHKENGGLADARNFGISKATGDYIMFVDSDDFLENNAIECILKYDIGDDVDIVVYGMIIDYEDGASVKKNVGYFRKLDKVNALIELNSYKNIDVSACNKLFKSFLFDDIKFPKGKLCEDYYIMYKLFDQCNSIMVIPENLYHYYQRKGSITHTEFNMDYIYASENQYNFLIKKYPNLKCVLKTNIAFAFVNLYNFQIKYGENRERYNYNQEMLIKKLKKYTRYIIMNKYLSMKKKIQYLLIVYTKKLYRYIIKKHTKRVDI